MAKLPQEQVNYSDPRYGVIHRSFFQAGNHRADDVATAGTHTESFLSLPVKAQIVGFGIMAASVDVVLATSDGFELRTQDGTRLATWVADSDYTLGTGNSTVCPPETATTIGKGKGMVACVATDVGVSGSVFYIVDWVEQFDAGSTK